MNQEEIEKIKNNIGHLEIIAPPMIVVHIKQLITYIDQLEGEFAKAKSDIQEMVKKAADQHLEGYRELGARAAEAENERDTVKAELAKLKAENERLKMKDELTWNDVLG